MEREREMRKKGEEEEEILLLKRSGRNRSNMILGYWRIDVIEEC